jgi:hypothetical protein
VWEARRSCDEVTAAIRKRLTTTGMISRLQIDKQLISEMTANIDSDRGFVLFATCADIAIK